MFAKWIHVLVYMCVCAEDCVCVCLCMCVSSYCESDRGMITKNYLIGDKCTCVCFLSVCVCVCVCVCAGDWEL